MRFFIDTAEIDEIRDLASTGLVDGVTTNPSLVAKSGRDFFEVLGEICALVPGPVSAEVAATDRDTMLAEARKLAELAENIVVKVPLTPDGLKACRALTDEGTQVNVTLCFSVPQAIFAAKAGAYIVSPFVGRLDDTGADGMALIRDIRQVYRNYDFATEVLVASIRNPLHVIEAARIGADIATIPAKLYKSLLKHPLTDSGLERCLEDYRNAQKMGATV